MRKRSLPAVIECQLRVDDAGGIDPQTFRALVGIGRQRPKQPRTVQALFRRPAPSWGCVKVAPPPYHIYRAARASGGEPELFPAGEGDALSVATRDVAGETLTIHALPFDGLLRDVMLLLLDGISCSCRAQCWHLLLSPASTAAPPPPADACGASRWQKNGEERGGNRRPRASSSDVQNVDAVVSTVDTDA